MSDYLKKPILSKSIDHTKNKGFAITTCEMQGWRRTMEDAHIHTQLEKDIHLFAVLDGHGGHEVAHYVSETLAQQLLNEPYFKLKNYHRALANTFRRIDQLLLSARTQQHLQSLAQSSSKYNQPISHRVGTTAIVLLLTPDRYFVANIGDSRAILSRNGQALPLSTDHKPDLPSEHNRITKAGGFVAQGRVNGTLSLSRSFGDYQYKLNPHRKEEQQCVISEPEITETERTEEDQFILLACDGVWERHVNNSQKMVSLLHTLLGKYDNSKIAMEKLFNELVAKDVKEPTGFDNMTAQLIQFQ